MGNMEIFEHMEKIDAYLQDEDAIIKLLYHMPLYRSGLSIFADGLFSANKEIAMLSCHILKKI